MDSEERHELQENDLAAFFKNFGEFWNQYGTWIVATVAAVALVFAGYNLITSQIETARQNAWLDLYGSVSYESYQLVAEEHSGKPAVVAAANLRGADLLLAQANEPTRVTRTSPTTSGLLNRDEALATAESMYQAAYDAAPDVLFRLNALEGLGVVAESRYDLDAARQRYTVHHRRSRRGVPELAGPGRATPRPAQHPHRRPRRVRPRPRPSLSPGDSARGNAARAVSRPLSPPTPPLAV